MPNCAKAAQSSSRGTGESVKVEAKVSVFAGGAKLESDDSSRHRCCSARRLSPRSQSKRKTSHGTSYVYGATGRSAAAPAAGVAGRSEAARIRGKRRREGDRCRQAHAVNPSGSHSDGLGDETDPRILMGPPRVDDGVRQRHDIDAAAGGVGVAVSRRTALTPAARRIQLEAPWRGLMLSVRPGLYQL